MSILLIVLILVAAAALGVLGFILEVAFWVLLTLIVIGAVLGLLAWWALRRVRTKLGT